MEYKFITKQLAPNICAALFKADGTLRKGRLVGHQARCITGITSLGDYHVSNAETQFLAFIHLNMIACRKQL